jgi:hypothetical protein
MYYDTDSLPETISADASWALGKPGLVRARQQSSFGRNLKTPLHLAKKLRSGTLKSSLISFAREKEAKLL